MRSSGYLDFLRLRGVGFWSARPRRHQTAAPMTATVPPDVRDLNELYVPFGLCNQDRTPTDATSTIQIAVAGKRPSSALEEQRTELLEAFAGIRDAPARRVAPGRFVMGNVDLVLLGTLLLGSIPGIVIGSMLMGKLPERALRFAIAVVLAAIVNLVVGADAFANAPPKLVQPVKTKPGPGWASASTRRSSGPCSPASSAPK